MRNAGYFQLVLHNLYLMVCFTGYESEDCDKQSTPSNFACGETSPSIASRILSKIPVILSDASAVIASEERIFPRVAQMVRRIRARKEKRSFPEFRRKSRGKVRVNQSAAVLRKGVRRAAPRSEAERDALTHRTSRFSPPPFQTRNPVQALCRSVQRIRDFFTARLAR